MAVLGTFSSFTTARLGIYASQASLNVTGNNIANINTKGYTRQRMDLVSLYSQGAGKYSNMYNRNIGYGVLAETRSQIRDPYLDIRYRNENVKLGAHTETLNSQYQMSHVLDEVGKGTGDDEGYGVIENQLHNLSQALENLSVNVGSQEYDDLVRGVAQELVASFNQKAEDLQTIWDDKLDQLHTDLTDVNKLLNEIRDLNEQIRTQALYGDNALELRDQRNLDLDALSEYLHINVEYSMERIDQFTEVEKLTVTLANSKGADGKPIKLIDGIYGGQINLQEKEPLMNPDYDPVKINAAKEETRKEAAANNPLENWKPGIDAQMEPIRQRIEAENAANQEPWATQITDARQAAIDRLLAQNPDATADEQNAAADAAEQAVNDERLAKIEADVKAEESALWREAAKQQQEIIDNAVKQKEEELIKTSGKYVKTPADPNANPPVAAEYTNDIAEAKIYDDKNSKLLLQVDPLKDQRDRLMTDPNTVSKKSEVVELDDTTLFGKLQALREMLTEEGEYASADDLNKNTDPPLLSGDPKASIKRGIPYYQKALDSLARQFAEVFNQANQLPATTVYQMDQAAPGPITGAETFKDAKGNPIQYTDKDGNAQDITADMVTKVKVDENGDPVLDEEGNEIRVPLERGDEGYEQAAECLAILSREGVKDPIYEFYDGGVLFSTNGNNNNPDGITAENISISNAWANKTVHILNDTRPDSYNDKGELITNSSRNDNILHMISLFNEQMKYDAKDIQADSDATLPLFKGSFREVYTSICGTLANERNVTNGMVESYSITTLDLENNRQSVSGVDLNDEATNMMQFSKSYSAACRLLTTIDSMLDKLINGTAV